MSIFICEYTTIIGQYKWHIIYNHRQVSSETGEFFTYLLGDFSFVNNLQNYSQLEQNTIKNIKVYIWLSKLTKNCNIFFCIGFLTVKKINSNYTLLMISN